TARQRLRAAAVAGEFSRLSRELWIPWRSWRNFLLTRVLPVSTYHLVLPVSNTRDHNSHGFLGPMRTRGESIMSTLQATQEHAHAHVSQPAAGTESLFSTYALGDLELPNRMVLSPMTRSRAIDGNVQNPLAASYYAQRASAGLIVTEATQVSPQGVGYIRTP